MAGKKGGRCKDINKFLEVDDIQGWLNRLKEAMAQKWAMEERASLSGKIPERL